MFSIAVLVELIIDWLIQMREMSRTIDRSPIHTIRDLPKRFALSRLRMFLKNMNPRMPHITNRKKVSFSIELDVKSPGSRRYASNSTIMIRPAQPVNASVLSFLIPASLRADAETMAYTRVAPIVVTSTIQPIAVLPRKGIGRVTAATRRSALEGMCSLLMKANCPGSTLSFESE